MTAIYLQILTMVTNQWSSDNHTYKELLVASHR